MWLRVIFLGCCLALALPAMADTIHLKNGRTILADRVRENGNRYEYEIGDDSYAIPKSAVERVDAGGVPVHAAADAKLPDLPSFTPPDSLAGEGDLVGKIIKEGKVDGDALAGLEGKGNPELTATADFIAGKFEFEHGNVAQSRRYFENGLRFQPDNSTILTYYAALLLRTGNAAQALPYAQHAARSAPDSPDAYAMLGYAQFANDRTKDAITSWKRSYELRPDRAVLQLLDKAERERSAESDFTENETRHFVLHYEGAQTSDALRRQILATLESDYDDLARDLGTPPRDNILVTLYTNTAFFDVTHAPAWAGALNDGKIRIPVSGLTSVTPELARVLKHELAHSFIASLASGRCPAWLNEGIAQLLEPKNLAGEGRPLAELFKAQQDIPLNMMESGFARFSGVKASIAYAESLAAVSYINDSYGMSDLQRILERLSQGNSTEAALRATIHSDYGQFQSDLGRYLADRYGD
ncbi:MAG TPA: peptidase MA family metallohydrolase [Candidatus Binatia bacterium]|nr:peptidase MA family metallohydrolase [Candidatus Binatia bacterium]